MLKKYGGMVIGAVAAAYLVTYLVKAVKIPELAEGITIGIGFGAKKVKALSNAGDGMIILGGTLLVMSLLARLFSALKISFTAPSIIMV
jgi:hypothetical protein